MTTITLNNSLENFLQQEIEAYRKFNHNTALDYKIWFYENSTTFTKVDEKLSKEIQKKNQCRIKQCYHNAWLLLSSDYRQNFRYFEGYEISNKIGIPIEHAWLMTANGKIIDPTLIINGKELQRQAKSEFGREQKLSYESRLPDEYFGMEIPKDFVIEQGIKNKRTGSFLFEYFEKQNLDKLGRKRK